MDNDTGNITLIQSGSTSGSHSRKAKRDSKIAPAGGGSQSTQQPAQPTGVGTGLSSNPASATLAKIGEKFKKLRGKSQPQAHRFLIDAISENLGVLCVPNEETGHIVLNLKDAMAMIREHEDFVKGAGQAEKSPLEAVREFLNA